ncbi:MAG: peptidoglycan editing factor PgeF [Rubrivivax sp.]|nr:peptidoglycan editing factor PgeF [Rubrivivax sp.]
MSQRGGGISAAPWNRLNLGHGVGDAPAAVDSNRARFTAALGGARPMWLRLVHGCDVLQLTPAQLDGPMPTADAAWTAERGIACTVSVADCLPVLLAVRDGRAVAAAHAGWRGLAQGVLEATVHSLCRGSGAVPGELLAWLGPCIGPRQFEVGADVLAAFGVAADGAGDVAHDAGFVYRPRPDGAPRWLADLPRLARQRLALAGVSAVAVDGACTVEDGLRFFSFRRDGVTGRMAAAIWRR